MPAYTSIHFTAGNQEISIDALDFILSILRDKAAGTSEEHSMPFVNCTASLCGDSDDGPVFTVQLESRLNHEVTTRNKIGPLATNVPRILQITVYRWCLANVDAVSAFFTHSFPLSSVSTMLWSYHSNIALDGDYWTTIFYACPALQELKIKG
jgi:hypothetical protein